MSRMANGPGVALVRPRPVAPTDHDTTDAAMAPGSQGRETQKSERMASFNKVILLGNLTRDPEVRSTPSGQTVTEIGVASNRTYTVGGPGGEKREEVTFVDVSFWGRAGELIAQYLHKGDPIFVEGRLNFRSWEAKDGGKRSKLSVVGENFQFIGGRSGEGGGDGGGRGMSRGSSGQSRGGSSGGEMESGGMDGGMEGFDEVPF